MFPPNQLGFPLIGSTLRAMQRMPKQLGVGTFSLAAEGRQNVLDALEHDRLSYGPFSRRFERAFAEAHECDYAVFVNSGTSALSLAVACLRECCGWEDGDEVLVPALTFVATCNVVLEHGLTPIFVDCDPRTYNIDPAKIEQKITPRTKAIIPVHLFGQVADMDPILAIARRHDLRIIEDSCETMWVRYRGKKTGSFGDISCFSTYVAHLIVTGVGGLALTNNKKYAEILRSLANHGRDNIYLSIDDIKDIDGAQFREVIRRRFRFIRRGYSFRATEMEAALGLPQVKELPAMIAVRNAHARFLREHLQPWEKYLQLPWYDETIQEHAFMMFPIVIRDGAPFSKDDLVQYLESWNVETRDMMPLINQPVYADMGIRVEEYPVADWVNRSGFYVGCHQGLSDEDLHYIVEVFAQFFRERGYGS